MIRTGSPSASKKSSAHSGPDWAQGEYLMRQHLLAAPRERAGGCRLLQRPSGESPYPRPCSSPSPLGVQGPAAASRYQEQFTLCTVQLPSSPPCSLSAEQGSRASSSFRVQIDGPEKREAACAGCAALARGRGLPYLGALERLARLSLQEKLVSCEDVLFLVSPVGT